MTECRQYPRLSPIAGQGVAPITFVTVHFSDEYYHNILASECVRDPVNQIITVDNRSNHAFESLGQAINAGLEGALHEFIVVVHEDVLLPRFWEQHLFRCVDQLERERQPWGLLGAAGWNTAPEQQAGVRMFGHWSDPHRYADTLQAHAFLEVERIDELIMVIRKSHGLRLDPKLPSIHNIGRDLPLVLRNNGLKTFVINAPPIHKYRDVSGELIQQPAQSYKIVDRQNPAYIADKSLSDDYFARKWLGPAITRPEDCNGGAPDLPPPVLLIAKGGSGSRLLSLLAEDLDVCIGRTNNSGDTMEMVLPVYRGVLRKFLDILGDERSLIGEEIRAAAIEMWSAAGSPALWGFKLPESVLLLEEMLNAFPGARVIHMIRDPMTTCLRRTHMTARLDNQIGRVTLPAAYRSAGRAIEDVLTDEPVIHMAYTTLHQVGYALDTLDALPPERCLELRFETLVADPARASAMASAWLGVEPSGKRLENAVDIERAAPRYNTCSAEVRERLSELLLPLRSQLGYAG
ncbi:MAG: sulfotransferase [Thiohalocapsa sp.]|nr:sulfotransferase [Thiohalocapsa sp.]